MISWNKLINRYNLNSISLKISVSNLMFMLPRGTYESCQKEDRAE